MAGGSAGSEPTCTINVQVAGESAGSEPTCTINVQVAGESAGSEQTEAVIQESFAELSTNRTTLVIAHRLSTIRHANRIVVVTEAGVEEQGSHDELLEHDGVYAKLYRAQFSMINV